MAQKDPWRFARHRYLHILAGEFRDAYRQLSDKERLQLSDILWGIIPAPEKFGIWDALLRETEKFSQYDNAIEAKLMKTYLVARGICVDQIPEDFSKLTQLATAFNYAVPDKGRIPIKSVNVSSVRQMAYEGNSSPLRQVLNTATNNLAAKPKLDAMEYTQITPNFSLSTCENKYFQNLVSLYPPEVLTAGVRWLRNRARKMAPQPFIMHWRAVRATLEKINAKTKKD